MRRQMNPMTWAVLALVLYWAVRSISSAQYDSPMDWVMEKVYLLPGILVGLAFHEFAHAYAADRLGDPTPRGQGRVTINPAAHIDPIGLVSLLLLGFGWGVPVQVNPRNFKHGRRDEIIVSLAGVTMNLLLAIVFTLLLKGVVVAFGYTSVGLVGVVETVLLEVVVINLVLMIFNLMPIPPLDGFNLITEVFNLQKYSWWHTVYQNGYIFLMVFIVFNISSLVIQPILSACLRVVFAVL